MARADFAGLFREVHAALGRPLKPSDQISGDVIAANEGRLGVRLPDSLRTYYSLAGNARFLHGGPNALLPPERWWVVRRVLVFAAEEQGVLHFGIRAEQAQRVDPAVYHESATGRGGYSPWKRGGLACSDLLVLLLCWQAVHGRMTHTGWAPVPVPAGEALVTRWPPLRRYLDLRAGYREGQVLCVLGPGTGARGETLAVHVGARTGEEFTALERDLADVGIKLLEVDRR